MNCVQEKIPVVAIIGRPNVGKSTLFNRLIGQRKTIVERMSGTTRDRIYADLMWGGKWIKLVDTGGVDFLSPDRISKAVMDQTNIAIAEAEIILFVCDVKDGVVGLDEEISMFLRKSNKRVFLVVNRADNDKLSEEAIEFYQLGLGEPYPISAMHGTGIGELLDEITANFYKLPTPAPIAKAIKVAIVGKPNVGKSSFLNCLLNEERVIVNDIPGTTRDSVDIFFKKDDVDFLLIDTAGIRHLRKIKTVVDVYGISRAKASIRRCDVSLILIDGMEGLRRDDLRILKSVIDEGKGCVIAVNKWDLVKEVTTENYEKAFRVKAPFAAFAPIIFTSALIGENVLSAIDAVKKVASCYSTTVKTGELNRVLGLIWKTNPRSKHGKEIKLYYATQVGTKPPSFLLFVGDKEPIKKKYLRYLEGQLRKKFNFAGTPIRINFRMKRKTIKSNQPNGKKGKRGRKKSLLP